MWTNYLTPSTKPDSPTCAKQPQNPFPKSLHQRFHPFITNRTILVQWLPSNQAWPSGILHQRAIVKFATSLIYVILLLEIIYRLIIQIQTLPICNLCIENYIYNADYIKFSQINISNNQYSDTFRIFLSFFFLLSRTW